MRLIKSKTRKGVDKSKTFYTLANSSQYMDVPFNIFSNTYPWLLTGWTISLRIF